MARLLEFIGRLIITVVICFLITQHYSYSYLNNLLEQQFYFLLGYAIVGVLLALWVISPILQELTDN